MLRNSEFDKAKAKHLENIQVLPHDIAFRKSYIHFLRTNNLFDEEFKQLKKLAALLKPDNKYLARVYNRMAIIAHRDLNKTQDGIQYAQFAINADHDYAPAYSTLAKMSNDRNYAGQLYEIANRLNSHRLVKHDVHLEETKRMLNRKKVQTESASESLPIGASFTPTMTTSAPVTQTTPSFAKPADTTPAPASPPKAKAHIEHVVKSISAMALIPEVKLHASLYKRQTKVNAPSRKQGNTAPRAARALRKPAPVRAVLIAPKQKEAHVADSSSANLMESVVNVVANGLASLYGIFSCCKSNKPKQNLNGEQAAHLSCYKR